MHPVFNNPSLQKQFDQKGYILLPSLLTDADVAMLNGLFQKYQEECAGPFHTSHFSSDIQYKKQVHDAITSLVYPKVAPYLNHFVSLFGNFMIKNPDPTVTMDLHADWAYVDERQYRSVAVWCPLTDTNIQNGCLGIIAGSHKVTNMVRGPLIRQSSRDHEPEWEKKFGRLLTMNAGDAIIYDHALLHYSPANKTETPRPAINLSMAPSDADWLHYCQPEGSDEIDIYEVSDTDFFLRYTHFQRPETGTVTGKMAASEVEYIDERMANFRPRRLLSKISEWF